MVLIFENSLSRRAELAAQALGFPAQILTAEQSEAERRALLSEAEIIFGEPSEGELSAARKLRWLQLSWAGAERYAAVSSRILLTTASGAFGDTVAEHALAMLFALCRRLPAYLKSGKWTDLGCEKPVKGATAMIFGCGDIGTNIAVRLKALGVKTVGVCRDARHTRTGFDALTTLPCAEAFLPEADFLLCAMPHSLQTAGYFDAERLVQAKPGAVLVNVGRGSFVGADALAEALQTGRLFGAGLDVTEPEPLPVGHPLWSLPNVILTPHVAGVSIGHLPEVEEKILGIFSENLRRYAEGRPLKNRVVLS